MQVRNRYALLAALYAASLSTAFAETAGTKGGDGSAAKEAVLEVREAVREKTATPPRRWGLTAGGSQRRDWLAGDRFDWPEFNARNVLGLPEWLSMTLEQRTRYETLDGRYGKGQKGGDQQIPLQTTLWVEAHHEGFRAGFEFMDARQFGADSGSALTNTMVDVGDFPQIYAAWSTRSLFDSGLGFEAKGGRQTLDLGSRRLVARNAFRNTTNAFTGLSLRLREGTGAWQVQAFASQPVVRLPEKAGLLDNDYHWNEEQNNAIFTGLFMEHQLPWNSRGELYLYYLQEDETSAKARDLYTPGLRLFRQPRRGEPDFEIETVAQVGSARESAKDRIQSVEAYYEHVQVGYTFELPWSPRLLAQYDYATGGSNRKGDVSYSFDTLYGARRWEYGPTGILGAFARNNINSPGYRLFVTPHDDVTFFAAHRLFWMANSTAAWQPAGLVDKTGHSGDFLGHLVEVSGRWDAHPNLSLESGWATLLKGGFARNAPGAPASDNVNYFYVQSMLRF